MHYSLIRAVAWNLWCQNNKNGPLCNPPNGSHPVIFFFFCRNRLLRSTHILLFFLICRVFKRQRQTVSGCFSSYRAWSPLQARTNSSQTD